MYEYFGLHIGAHEIGHTLGLMHPFSGSEAGMYCDNPCFEGTQYASNQTGSELIGDMISDTRPTVMYTSRTNGCADPPLSDCVGVPWRDTPFRNIMTFGYLTKNCVTAASAFTPMQHGRMRCFAEDTYKQWHIAGSPSSNASTLAVWKIAVITISSCIVFLGVACMLMRNRRPGPRVDHKDMVSTVNPIQC